MHDRQALERHYGTDPLRGQVDAGLRAAGLGEGELDWTALAPLDQFHVRGLEATRELAEALGLTAGSTLIDIGSGLGGPARFLAATHHCEVTGIDLSQPFVEVATYLSERCGLSKRTSFRQADALDLPFAPASFDCGFTQHVAMNIADRARLYGEIARVLKPGGRLGIYDVVKGEGGPLIFPVPWARSPEISFVVTPETMRAALAGAGFAEISWDDTTELANAWFARVRAAAPAGQPPLGLPTVMGPDFAVMAANLGRNLAEGRARLVRAVFRR